MVGGWPSTPWVATAPSYALFFFPATAVCGATARTAHIAAITTRVIRPGRMVPLPSPIRHTSSPTLTQPAARGQMRAARGQCGWKRRLTIQRLGKRRLHGAVLGEAGVSRDRFGAGLAGDDLPRSWQRRRRDTLDHHLLQSG